MKIATGTLIFALFSVLYSTKICQIQPCLDDSWYKITHSRLTVGLNYSFLALFWLSGSWLDTYWICQILYWVSSLPWDSFSSCPLAMESLHLLQVDCLAVLVVFDWYPELLPLLRLTVFRLVFFLFLLFLILLIYTCLRLTPSPSSAWLFSFSSLCSALAPMLSSSIWRLGKL